MEDEYSKVELERNELYQSFEESLRSVERQSDFHNQALESRLKEAENNSQKAAVQVEEIIRAADLDLGEIQRVMGSLSHMLSVKDEALSDMRFQVVKLKKGYNDSMDAFRIKLRELGIPDDEFNAMGFRPEAIPSGSTLAPAGLVARN